MTWSGGLFILLALVTGHLYNFLVEFDGVKGFTNDTVCPDLKCSCLLMLQNRCGDGNDGGVVCLLFAVTTDLFYGLEPTHYRHMCVHQYKVIMLFLGFLHRQFPVFYDIYPAIPAMQHMSEHKRVKFIVLRY